MPPYNIQETTTLDTKLCSKSKFLSAKAPIQTKPVNQVNQIGIKLFLDKIIIFKM